MITCVSGSILSGMDICCFFWHSTHLFPENIKLIRLPGCQLSNEQKIFPIFSPHKIRLNFIFWQGKCFCETFYNFKLKLGNNKWCRAWHFSLLYSNICWNSQSSRDNQTNLMIICKICQLVEGRVLTRTTHNKYYYRAEKVSHSVSLYLYKFLLM